MNKISILLVLILIFTSCGGSDTAILTIEDTTTTTVAPSTTTTVQDTTTTTTTTTDFVPNCNLEGESKIKLTERGEHIKSLGFDTPDCGNKPLIIYADSTPQYVIDEFIEVQTLLHNALGAYNRYAEVLYTTEEECLSAQVEFLNMYEARPQAYKDQVVVDAFCLPFDAFPIQGMNYDKSLFKT